MKTEPNDLAYPFACQGPTTGPEMYYGLTKREVFAMAAMQGILAANREILAGMDVEKVAAMEAVAYADALIAALNREQP